MNTNQLQSLARASRSKVVVSTKVRTIIKCIDEKFGSVISEILTKNGHSCEAKSSEHSNAYYIQVWH